MNISTILDQIDLGAMALPEFQRGYVWNRDQVRGLMHSLYLKHPVGGLLVWVTRAESATARGGQPLAAGTIKLLLDGQQRITSLYGIIRGKPPKFFDGNPQTFSGIYFHLDDEIFEFYAPLKMKDNPLWINVTELMQDGVAKSIQRLLPVQELQPKISTYINRINAVHAIQSITLHIEEVTGEDKTLDVVVDIFNRVNSGGTKLSKGDLALAKVCAGWPEARGEMRTRINKWWIDAGFDFDLDWLLRNMTALVTGQALFSGLEYTSRGEIESGLNQTETLVNYLLMVIGGRLGLDHDRVLGSRYAFPVMVRYLALHGGRFPNAKERDQLLGWYVHSLLWGRYSGSTESVINQDLRHVDATPATVDRLLDQLRLFRGDLLVRPDDFGGATLGARFYPMLYLLTRVHSAKDWGNGLPLTANLLGRLSRLEVHHIFPRALLQKYGYGRNEINAIANFCFLTQDTNLAISDRPPEVYFEEVERNHPGALASQWIPVDRDLWKIERFLDFLAARRELLAQSSNTFLEGLLDGIAPQATDAPVLALPAQFAPGGVQSEAEDQLLQDLRNWISEQGLPTGEYLYELADPATGDALAIFDLAWPKGLQIEFSQPVALLIEESKETEEAANRAGFRFFTDVDSFRAYIERDILALSGADS